jgi:hypothetical protein
MRVQGLPLLLLGQLPEHFLGGAERVLSLGEQLDQPRAALEELSELVGRQLPR